MLAAHRLITSRSSITPTDRSCPRRLLPRGSSTTYLYHQRRTAYFLSIRFNRASSCLQRSRSPGPVFSSGLAKERILGQSGESVLVGDSAGAALFACSWFIGSPRSDIVISIAPDNVLHQMDCHLRCIEELLQVRLAHGLNSSQPMVFSPWCVGHRETMLKRIAPSLLTFLHRRPHGLLIFLCV